MSTYFCELTLFLSWGSSVDPCFDGSRLFLLLLLLVFLRDKSSLVSLLQSELGELLKALRLFLRYRRSASPATHHLRSGSPLLLDFSAPSPSSAGVAASLGGVGVPLAGLACSAGSSSEGILLCPSADMLLVVWNRFRGFVQVEVLDESLGRVEMIGG